MKEIIINIQIKLIKIFFRVLTIQIFILFFKDLHS